MSYDDMVDVGHFVLRCISHGRRFPFRDLAVELSEEQQAAANTLIGSMERAAGVPIARFTPDQARDFGSRVAALVSERAGQELKLDLERGRQALNKVSGVVAAKPASIEPPAQPSKVANSGQPEKTLNQVLAEVDEVLRGFDELPEQTSHVSSEVSRVMEQLKRVVGPARRALTSQQIATEVGGRPPQRLRTTTKTKSRPR